MKSPHFMKVPFLDLKAHHARRRDQFEQAIHRVIESGEFAGGSFTEAFERDYAAFCGVRHAIGVSSGTDAVWLSLLALGIGPGDEVITVPMTFIATAEAISRTGATPVFVDIEELTHTLDPDLLEEAITERTKAIVPVHLYGRLADMRRILEIADRYHIPVVEDAAQAHGARDQEGRRAGSFGSLGCFSFYPGKNLGAFGEAGAVTTDDDQLAEQVRVYRHHGQTSRNDHKVIGWNSRMDGIQAAVLRVKLQDLEENNELRRKHAARYQRELAGIPGITLPGDGVDEAHVHHLFVVRVPHRDAFLEKIDSEGIGYGIHYPTPVHLQGAYSSLGHGVGSFPVSERCARECVSLPIFPELSEAQQDHVIEGVKRASEATIAA